eukprot:RCo049248
MTTQPTSEGAPVLLSMLESGDPACLSCVPPSTFSHSVSVSGVAPSSWDDPPGTLLGPSLSPAPPSPSDHWATVPASSPEELPAPYLESVAVQWAGDLTPTAGAGGMVDGAATFPALSSQPASPLASEADPALAQHDPQLMWQQFEAQRALHARGIAPHPLYFSEEVRNYFRPMGEVTKENRMAEKELELDTSSASALLSQGLEKLLKECMEFVPKKSTEAFRTVRYENLKYTATISAKHDEIDSVGNRLLNIFWFWRGFRRTDRVVLHDLTGTLRPGRGTLILGPPKSGKSSFMKILAGRALENYSNKVTGNISYNGIPRKEVLVNKITTYISQRDEHFPTLTVRDTVEFAMKALFGLDQLKVPPDSSFKVSHEQLMKVWKLTVEIQLTLLGIDHVADTIIGNDMLRGISGGQKRRVTSAEMLVCWLPIIFCD